MLIHLKENKKKRSPDNEKVSVCLGDKRPQQLSTSTCGTEAHLQAFSSKSGGWGCRRSEQEEKLLACSLASGAWTSQLSLVSPR